MAGAFRPGLTVEAATDVLLTMFGDSVHHQLVTDHGWGHDQVVEHLCDALPRVLLESPGARGVEEAS